MVDPTKIVVIVNSKDLKNVKWLQAMLGNIGYYKKFIKAYAQITTLVEKLMKKDTTFSSDEECQQNLDVLEEQIVTALILVFLDWKKEFHVHVDASCIMLDVVLTQPGEDENDHLISFTSRKLSKVEKNHSTTEHEGLVMVYML